MKIYNRRPCFVPQADEHLQKNQKGQLRAVVLRQKPMGVLRRQHQDAVEGHVGGRSKTVLLRHETDVVGLLRAGLCHWFAFVFGQRRPAHVKGREDQVGKVSVLYFCSYLPCYIIIDIGSSILIIFYLQRHSPLDFVHFKSFIFLSFLVS